MKRTFAAILIFALFAVAAFAGHSASTHSTPAAPTAPKSVSVKGYTRSDGTYVHSYRRAAPTGQQSTEPANLRPEQPTVTPQRTLAAQANVRVLADPNTKRYYRETCAAPESAMPMSRSSAIAAGYRPDPACFAKQ